MVKVTNKSKRLLGIVWKTDEIGQVLKKINLKPGHNVVDDDLWEEAKKTGFVKRLKKAEIIEFKDEEPEKREKKKSKKSKSIEV